MNGELLRLVDSIRREKNIPREVILEGIEAALASAVRKHLGGGEEILVAIDRESGEMRVTDSGETVEVELGRIAAQTAKQVIIQKIREAERDSLFDEFEDMKGVISSGVVQRQEGGAYIVNLGKTEGILPKSESIPGETPQPGERVRAVVMDVRKSGQRVKIVLSRTHPDFVRRLFEIEVPEISDRVIEIKAMAREAGYRTKIAVSSIDSKVDCVGACVGVRGTRIKNIVDELGGEKIDIVRWNDALQVLIPNALKPAEIDDIVLCPELDRAIVIVRDDQLSLAIGRRGQNVRLASRLVCWDIEIMTAQELVLQKERAAEWFSQMPNVGEKLVEKLVEKTFLSYEDLSLLEPEHLTAIEGIGQKRAEEIIAFATKEAERLERETPEVLTNRLRPPARPAAERDAEQDAEQAAVEALRRSLQDEAQQDRKETIGAAEAARQLFGESTSTTASPPPTAPDRPSEPVLAAPEAEAAAPEAEAAAPEAEAAAPEAEAAAPEAEAAAPEAEAAAPEAEAAEPEAVAAEPETEAAAADAQVAPAVMTDNAQTSQEDLTADTPQEVGTPEDIVEQQPEASAPGPEEKPVEDQSVDSQPAEAADDQPQPEVPPAETADAEPADATSESDPSNTAERSD